MKIGLFFGSFNPIHVGHLIIANYMIEFTDLDKIWFVVSPQNPFKLHDNLLPEKHRLNMVQLAIQNNPYFEVSDIEFTLAKPSFTIHTLEALNKNYPGSDFTLVMGSDNLADLHKWKGYEEIINNYRLFVYYRNGFENQSLSVHPNVRVFEAPVLNISATFIRDVLQKRKSVKYLLTAEVEEYMWKHCVSKL
jgi:nicotinate-nucleotide adenylyltransferase